MGLAICLNIIITETRKHFITKLMFDELMKSIYWFNQTIMSLIKIHFNRFTNDTEKKELTAEHCTKGLLDPSLLLATARC